MSSTMDSPCARRQHTKDLLRSAGVRKALGLTIPETELKRTGVAGRDPTGHLPGKSRAAADVHHQLLTSVRYSRQNPPNSG